MSSNTKTNNSITSVRQVLNERARKIFEKNLRCLLEINYCFKSLKYPDLIFSKKIRVKKGNKIEERDIFQNEDSIIIINNNNYSFFFNKNFEVELIQ